MNTDLTLSTETEILLRALKAVPLGSTITYRDLSAAIGRSVTAEARNKLASARAIALRDNGIGFTSERGVGLRRITVEEAPGMGAVARGRIRSTARRASAAIRSVVAASNGASPEAARRISSEIAVLGLIAEAASEPMQKAFESDGPVMSPALAGEAFLKHLGAV